MKLVTFLVVNPVNQGEIADAVVLPSFNHLNRRYIVITKNRSCRIKLSPVENLYLSRNTRLRTSPIDSSIRSRSSKREFFRPVDRPNDRIVQYCSRWHPYLFWLYPATWASRRSRESRPLLGPKIKSTMRPPVYRTRQDWRLRPAAEVSSYGCRAWSSPASCPDPGSKVVSQPETGTRFRARYSLIVS